MCDMIRSLEKNLHAKHMLGWRTVSRMSPPDGRSSNDYDGDDDDDGMKYMIQNPISHSRVTFSSCRVASLLSLAEKLTQVDITRKIRNVARWVVQWSSALPDIGRHSIVQWMNDRMISLGFAGRWSKCIRMEQTMIINEASNYVTSFRSCWSVRKQGNWHHQSKATRRNAMQRKSEQTNSFKPGTRGKRA